MRKDPHFPPSRNVQLRRLIVVMVTRTAAPLQLPWWSPCAPYPRLTKTSLSDQRRVRISLRSPNGPRSSTKQHEETFPCLVRYHWGRTGSIMISSLWYLNPMVIVMSFLGNAVFPRSVSLWCGIFFWDFSRRRRYPLLLSDEKMTNGRVCLRFFVVQCDVIVTAQLCVTTSTSAFLSRFRHIFKLSASNY